MYGSYHDLEKGPYNSRRISDLFPGIVGPIDAAFDDNTYVYIVQGMIYITVHTTDIIYIWICVCMKMQRFSFFNTYVDKTWRHGHVQN